MTLPDSETESSSSSEPSYPERERRHASMVVPPRQLPRVLRDGLRFGKYEIVRLIAIGGMSEVYEAIHVGLKKRVALKIMRPDLAESGESRRRFVSEGVNAARIRHTNVVDVTDVGEVDELPYLVMTLLEGDDLGTLLDRQGQMAAPEIVDILLPVASAVALGHTHGVVHRDLKPNNIFLHREGTRIIPKVLDFGVSRVMSARRITLNSSVFGTPHYMSPEQARGGPTDARTDQYALGVILYEALTGRLPRDSPNPLELLHSVAYESFRPPSDFLEISAELEAVILRVMAHDPEARFLNMREFANALVPFASTVVQEYWRVELGLEFPEDGDTQRLPGAARPTTPPLAALAHATIELDLDEPLLSGFERVQVDTGAHGRARRPSEPAGPAPATNSSGAPRVDSGSHKRVSLSGRRVFVDTGSQRAAMPAQNPSKSGSRFIAVQDKGGIPATTDTRNGERSGQEPEGARTPTAGFTGAADPAAESGGRTPRSTKRTPTASYARSKLATNRPASMRGQFENIEPIEIDIALESMDALHLSPTASDAPSARPPVPAAAASASAARKPRTRPSVPAAASGAAARKPSARPPVPAAARKPSTRPPASAAASNSAWHDPLADAPAAAAVSDSNESGSVGPILATPTDSAALEPSAAPPSPAADSVAALEQSVPPADAAADPGAATHESSSVRPITIAASDPASSSAVAAVPPAAVTTESPAREQGPVAESNAAAADSASTETSAREPTASDHAAAAAPDSAPNKPSARAPSPTAASETGAHKPGSSQAPRRRVPDERFPTPPQLIATPLKAELDNEVLQLELSAPRPRRRSAALAAAAAGVILVAAAGGVWFWQRGPRDLGASAVGPIAGSGAQLFAVEIRTSPSSAQIALDGVVVGTGAYNGSLPHDGVSHELVVSADAHQTRSLTFRDQPPDAFIELTPTETRTHAASDDPSTPSTAPRRSPEPARPAPASDANTLAHVAKPAVTPARPLQPAAAGTRTGHPPPRAARALDLAKAKEALASEDASPITPRIAVIDPVKPRVRILEDELEPRVQLVE